MVFMLGERRSKTRWSMESIELAKKKSTKEVCSSLRLADFKSLSVAETDIQQDFMDQISVIRYQGRPLKDYIYAIPNGGYRAKKTARILKAEGVKKGVPDTHCFIAKAPYHSLYIEFKTERGALRPEQEAVIAMLREQGHKVVVCRSTQSGITEILKYLGLSV